MNPQVQYRIALLKESVEISGQLLLIRLHLKSVTEYEFELLNKRAEYLQQLIKETRT